MNFDLNSLILLFAAIVAGLIGSLVGLGGGIIIIPTLTLILGVDIHFAIGASLVSVLANSAAAASRYVKEKITNIRLAVLLELASASGAIIGALIALKTPPHFLFILFGVMLIVCSVLMWKGSDPNLSQKNEAHPLANKLKLNTPEYNVSRVPQGLAVMTLAGIVSALMGLGGGIFKVLALDRLMKLPIKASTATSNFMLGVTAAAGAATYFLHGYITAPTATPVAIGNFVGALIGSRLMMILPDQVIRKVFVVVLTLIALQMIWKGLSL
ncbi:MAG: sulfite exporter TauE/SafE family protein [Pseudobdellovibrionaceae bacterium]